MQKPIAGRTSKFITLKDGRLCADRACPGDVDLGVPVEPGWEIRGDTLRPPAAPKPSLQMRRLGNVEVVHCYDAFSGDMIASRGNVVQARVAGEEHTIRLPVKSSHRLLMASRLARRALRLDKGNAVLSGDRSAMALAYRGVLYRYDMRQRRLEATGRLSQCRNALHQSFLALDEQRFYVGEYGRNPSRQPVPLWMSEDGARSWRVAHTFPAKSIKHIHGVYHDPFEDRIWVTTGDFAGECGFLVGNRDFSEVAWLGDGSQRWRAVTLMFTPDRVLWAQDTPLETSHVYSYDRRTGRLTCGQELPGPAWYSKRLEDGRWLLQTSVEVGPGVTDEYAYLLMSEDLEHWRKIARFRKDCWPMHYFKFGVLAFADGPQTSRDFALFGEALVGFDGCAALCGIEMDDAG